MGGKRNDSKWSAYLNLVLNAFATYLSAPVPEPSIWATMLIGFGLCYTAFRRGRGRVSTA
jgi:hypothetical protein